MEQESFIRLNGRHHEEGGHAGVTYSADGSWEDRNISPEDYASRASETPPSEYGMRDGYQCRYGSAEEAHEARAKRINSQIDREAIAELLDIPNHPNCHKRYILKLYNAFLSVDTEGEYQIIDKPGKNGNLAQAAQRILDRKYPTYAVEEICWEIFDKAMLAQAGIILVDKHHGAKFQTPPQFLSFDDRWNTIVRSCRCSKALCKMNLDPSFIDRFVANPEAEYRMKLNNKKINAQRDEQNEIGRTFLSSGLKKQDAKQLLKATNGGNGDEGDSPTGPPNRRADLSHAAPATPVSKARPSRGTGSKRRKTSSPETEDSDDDDDDEYVDSAYRSSARPPRRSSRQAASSKPRAISNNNRQLSSPSVRRGTGTEHRPLAMVPPHNSNADNRDHDHFKRIIFKLLGVDESKVKLNDYELGQLRTYARAYNEPYMTIRYSFPGWLDSVAKGHRVSIGTATWEHFAILDRSMLPLAITRGDLIAGGGLYDKIELNENGNRTFKARTGLERQALGMDDNVHGIHSTYRAAQPPILRSQSQSNVKLPYTDGLQRDGNMVNEEYHSDRMRIQGSQSFDQFDRRPHQVAEQQHHSAYQQPEFKPRHSPNMFGGQSFNDCSSYESVNPRNEARFSERHSYAAHQERYIHDGYQYGANQNTQGYHTQDYPTFSNGSNHGESQYPDPGQYAADQHY